MSRPNRRPEDVGVPEVVRAVRSLRRRVAVQRRRIEEHVHGDCGRGTVREPCAWIAYERGILVGLWRALRELGVERPEEVAP